MVFVNDICDYVFVCVLIHSILADMSEMLEVPTLNMFVAADCVSHCLL